MKTKMQKILLLLLWAPVGLLAQSFYDFTVKDIDGNDFRFEQLKGKKVMVVNTASKCGFTPQYEQLEALYKQYADSGFIIIAFPSNDFKKQEPGSEQEIKRFCQTTYGVSFPLMSKIHVKGDSIHPVYGWLTQKSLNGKFNSKVKWNFQKYLINERGELEKVISPWTKPDSKKILEWIKGKTP